MTSLTILIIGVPLVVLVIAKRRAARQKPSLAVTPVYSDFCWPNKTAPHRPYDWTGKGL